MKMMTETTALVRLCDIVDYHGDPRDAYKAVISGLESGTITTSLPSWEDVGCMQTALAANSRAWYTHLEEHLPYSTVVDESLILRHLLLDATLETMIHDPSGVDPYNLLQILTEKVATERCYGTPIGRSFDESVKRCVAGTVPVAPEVAAMVLSHLYEKARSTPQNHILARHVAETLVERFQGTYTAHFSS